MPNKYLTISQDGINLIKEFEGLRLRAYQDSVGVWTIGYGHTATAYAGMTITEQQANQLLQDDIKSHLSQMYKLVKVPLTQSQFDALASFHFNLGPHILEGTQLLTYINNKQWQKAADELLLYNKAGGRTLPGLVRRRQAEANLFLSNAANTTTETAEYQEYTIVSGDSLWRIAQRFNTTVDELVRLNNFPNQNVTIHPGQRIIVARRRSSEQPTPINTNNALADTIIQWFQQRIGVVGYSQDSQLRQGPHYYDCSSAIYAALIHAGILPQQHLGWTGSLLQLQGSLFDEIDRSQVRKGDFFISFDSYSDTTGIHTGFFVNANTIVHCVNEKYGMKQTDFSYSWVGSNIVKYYRLKALKDNNSTPVPTPTPQPNPIPAPVPQDEKVISNYSESGTFTANRSVVIRNNPTATSPSVATLYNGESVIYDSVYITNKFVYISYISYSGTRRYVAVRTITNGQRGPLWGTII